MSLKQAIIDQAQAEGFSLCRFTQPDSIPHVPDKLSDFIDAGYHGQMSWMADRQTWRANPRALWPDAQTIIMLGESYAPDHDPTDILKHPEKGAISVYAQNKDYHDLVKKRLKRLARWLIAHSGGEVKVFVDTAPVSEKPLGQAAGLGWQGKHTNLVSRDLGNWFFIGSVFTTLSIEPDRAEVDHCGSCRSCITACPTDAFPAPYQLDARRCISYLTIEHSGPVDVDLRRLMGNRIYGCDDCLAACPWNKFAKEASDIRYHARADLMAPDLGELAMLDDAAFRTKFSGSPIKRIGRNRFVRNVLYAIGNSQRPDLLPVAQGLIDDSDPTVSDAARWAVQRLSQMAR
ncbi:MAG: tRNA epoxyqueuosine(34) reductase QueG [Paracoccaceae bacterium]